MVLDIKLRPILSEMDEIGLFILCTTANKKLSLKEVGFENVTWMQTGTMILIYAGRGGFGIAGAEYL